MKKTFLIVVAIMAIGAFGLAQLVSAQLPSGIEPGSEIKVEGQPGIYYVSEEGLKHAYPDMATLLSWYPAMDYEITTVSQEDFDAIPAGDFSRVQPGTLVKFTDRPGVYRSDSYKLLCYVTSTAMADRVYGEDWRELIAHTVVSYDSYNNIGLCREAAPPTLTFIRAKGFDVQLNGAVRATSPSHLRVYEFTLAAINNDGSIDLSYSTAELGQPCSSAEEGTDTLSVPTDTLTCVSSNSCDGGDEVCFTSERVDGIINLDWEVNSWTSEPF